MSLLEITNLSHSFGDKILFKNTEMTINKGEHIGLVGQNGTGKSTLIKICTDQIIPDEGQMIWQPDISIGYLDQYARVDQDMTMRVFLKRAFKELYFMKTKMNELYEKSVNGNTALLKQAAYYQEQLEQKNFYMIDTYIEQVAQGLGLLSIGLERSLKEMSGGQRAKVILAKLLLEKPDVLLLDEPTNFLDQEHISWLAEYLSGLENAFMVISHDDAFLEKITSHICDIDNLKITKYYGTYAAFSRKKSMLREDYIRQYNNQQKEIEKTEAFIRKNIAGIKSKMARGRRKQLSRMDRMEALEQKEIRPVFRFKELAVTNTKHLLVKHLSVGYQYPILSDLNFSVTGGQKVVITGFNGIGKTTLLKTLVDKIPIIAGEFHFSEQVTVGYFEQDLKWEDAEQSPFQIVSNRNPALQNREIRILLARCGISSKHAMQAIGTLSGGEQTKVKLCLLLMKPYNFLIMDEPTNHLDKQAKESLKVALSEFSGTVLLVSHGEEFYKGWTQQIIDIKQCS